MKIIGHRGARGLFPENTVEGFRACLDRGWQDFEIDVGVLRCGTVVVHHDLALNPDVASLDGRWLGGSLPLLRQLDWEELQDFEVGRIRPGSPYAAEYPHQTPIDGARVPRLADVLALDPACTWFIEMKRMPDRPDWTASIEAMVEGVLAVVDAAGAADRVVLQSFDWRAPRRVRAIRPELARSWLTSPNTESDPGLWWGPDVEAALPRAVADEGGQTWAPHWERLTQAQVDEAHALGLRVVPWTVNEPDAMQRLASWGVDGVITDYPDRAP